MKSKIRTGIALIFTGKMGLDLGFVAVITLLGMGFRQALPDITAMSQIRVGYEENLCWIVLDVHVMGLMPFVRCFNIQF